MTNVQKLLAAADHADRQGWPSLAKWLTVWADHGEGKSRECIGMIKRIAEIIK